MYSVSVNNKGIYKRNDTSEEQQRRMIKSEILQRVYMKDGGQPRECLETWNLLMQRVSQGDAQNILNFVMAAFVGEYFRNEDEFVGLLCDTDDARIDFENKFASRILTARNGCLERAELSELASAAPASAENMREQMKVLEM